MKILSQNLPTKIKVNDKIYDINYDYKTAILTLQCFEDEELDIYDKAEIVLKNIYKNQSIPKEDIEEAYKKAIKFLDCGNEYKEEKIEPRVYSFVKDENYIFSGINSSHGINLLKEKDLHWWVFMSLFMDMNDKCFFSEIVYYRKRKNEGKLTKEEKRNYLKIKDLVDLDSHKTISKEKESFLRELNS